MTFKERPLRVLYSFPHKLGAGRICDIAWQQVNGVHAAGAEVLVFPGAVHRPIIAPGVKTRPTLARGKVRIPYRLLGIKRACALHDRIVARRLAKLAGQIDVIHAWPSAALETLKAAARLGVPVLLERPNTHTRYAYRVVQDECKRLGVTLPPGSEHAFDQDLLDREEAEYRLADRLLCPSEFVEKTFLDEGFAPEKLARHRYGYDPQLYFPGEAMREDKRGLTVLFAGLCAVRKGLHFALEAWLKSPAHRDGMFLIAGEFLPAYADKLSAMLGHSSVQVLGQRTDMPALMRRADILVLPSIEEGSALVTSEGRASGCVLLVSEAAGAVCRHMDNALVHRVGDVQTIERQFTLLHEDRALLERLRAASLHTVSEITWRAAGVKLLEIYNEVAARNSSRSVAEVFA